MVEKPTSIQVSQDTKDRLEQHPTSEKCPKCGSEVSYQKSDTELTAIEEVESIFPVQILCQCTVTYRCIKCATLVIVFETRDYYITEKRRKS